MARIALALVASALVASSFCACQRKKKTPKEEARAVRVLPRADIPMLVLAEGVLDPGKGPRTLLRYRPLPQKTLTVQLQASAELTETINGKRREPLSLPSVTTRFELSWKGDGAHVVVAVARAATIAESNSAEASQAARGLIAHYNALLRDEASELPTSDRGQLGLRPLSDPTEAGKQRGRAYVGALADIIVPLPEVPVGVGARWRVVRAVPRARTSVKQTIIYELVDNKDGVIVVKLSGKMIGERQPIDAPNLPSDARAELLALRATVDGQLTIDLKDPAASAGHMVRTDTIHTRATRSGQMLTDYFSESTSTISVAATR